MRTRKRDVATRVLECVKHARARECAVLDAPTLTQVRAAIAQKTRVWVKLVMRPTATTATLTNRGVVRVVYEASVMELDVECINVTEYQEEYRFLVRWRSPHDRDHESGVCAEPWCYTETFFMLTVRKDGSSGIWWEVDY